MPAHMQLDVQGSQPTPAQAARSMSKGLCASSSGVRRLRTVLWLLCVASVACSSGKPPEVKRRNGPVGTLMGEIHLAPGYSMPEYLSLDMVRRPLRQSTLPQPPAECEAANEAARHPVTMTARGLLGGVVVAASDFTRVRERAPKTHKVVIDHCRLKPSIIDAQGGDTLLLENHDAYGFEPLIGPAFDARPLPKGKNVKLPLVGAGIDSVQCSLGAPCGRTDLLVFHHPVHAVSNDAGQFRMTNFPAGELVRVTAWHPLFEPTETFVWLEPSQVTTVNLQLTPKQRFLPKQAQAAVSATAPSP